MVCATLALSAAAFGCSPQQGAGGFECVAPAAAGGGWDMTCRVTARALQDLGLIEGRMRTTNRPGAGGGIGYAHAVGPRDGDPGVIFAASTGTTLLLAQDKFGRLHQDDVRWLGALGAEYGIVAVARDAPWPDLPALLRDWRSDPTSVVVSGGSAVTGQDHMKVLLLGREAGIDPRSIRYVPFDGGAEALTALLGGFVDVFSGDASEIEALMQTGDLRPLAILAPERTEGPFGSVPTATEQGVPVTWITWRGFYLPPGNPDSTYAQWVGRMDSLAVTPAWADARRRARLEPFHLTGPEFETFIAEQIETFRSMALELGLIEES